jgi:hypothetical protein
MQASRCGLPLSGRFLRRPRRQRDAAAAPGWRAGLATTPVNSGISIESSGIEPDYRALFRNPCRLCRRRQPCSTNAFAVPLYGEGVYFHTLCAGAPQSLHLPTPSSRIAWYRTMSRFVALLIAISPTCGGPGSGALCVWAHGLPTGTVQGQRLETNDRWSCARDDGRPHHRSTRGEI